MSDHLAALIAVSRFSGAADSGHRDEGSKVCRTNSERSAGPGSSP